MNSSIDFEKLNTEMKLHEKTVQKIIRITKKIFLDSNGDNTLNSILEKKWNELQQYVHLYSSIISKIKEVVKCCEATNTVEEGIRVICKYHNQLIINSDTTEKEELLAAVENCYNKLQTIENDSSSLINDPILKEYAPNVLIFLESRITLVKALFTEVQNAIKKQIKKEDELSEKYFYVECEAIEHWIKHTIELMNTDFDYDEIERMEKLLQTTKNIMAVKCSKMTIKMVKFADEQFEAGFAEARLKIQKINEAYIKLGNIIHEKGFYIENLKIIYKFFDEQESLLLFAKHQRKMIYSINDNNQLPEYEQMLKELEEKILQLICRSENIVKLNFEDEIKAKIKVLQETINSLWRLLEAKYQNLKLTYDLVDFYEIAQEALTCFEECFGELEASDQMSLKLSILIKNESSDYTLFYAEKIGIQLFNGYKRNNSVPAFTLARKYMQKVVQAKEIWNVIYQKLEKGIPYFKEIEEFDKISCGVKHFLNGFPIEGKSDNEMKKQESLAEIDCKIEQLVQIAKEITEKEKNLAEYFYMNLHGIKKMYQLCFDNDDQKDEKSFEEKPSLLPIHSTIKFVSSAPNSTNEKYLIPKKLKLYDDKINAVGIDLGTSRCCTAVNRNNKMETVALDNNGERPLPSYVSFDEKDEKCGKIVVDGLLKNLEKFTCFDIKRIIGKKYSNIISDKSWPFTIIEKNGKIFVKTANSHGEITKTPEEISAVLLKYIKEKVSTFQGKTLTEAVLTVPAAFTEKQKEATLKAAKLAGWEKIHLLPEPVAASFAYFNNREIPNNSNVLLFDLGGGTLDVCLFHINEGSLKIITSNGNTCLGGRDIDNLLMRHFTTALKFKYNINVNKKVKRKYQLLIECQNIKHNLSVRESDLLDPEKFDSGIEGGSIEIERCELEEMMTELIQRMKLIIIETLENAKMDHNEVNKVLLVGGGCRMPIVKTMLKNMFPNADQCCEEQPDEVVTVGAAIYAYHLATTNEKQSENVETKKLL